MGQIPSDPLNPPVRAAYADRFRCIGSDCEDTCCSGWTVPVDRETWDKYQNLPESPLRVLLHSSLERTPEPADGTELNPALFGKIRMDASHKCPLLTADRLCSIHAQLGESMLSYTCATYPRIVHSAGGVEEKALALSCPEAARLVLLTPDLLSDAELSRTDEPGQGDAPGFPPDYWAIRASVLRLVRNRSYPLWQRLFLLGIFCRRLDSIAQGELRRAVSEFLRNFEATINTRALQSAMETLPIDWQQQLDLVLRLAGLMLHHSNVRQRFVDCVQAFTKGIGNAPNVTLPIITAQYAAAHERYYEPFFSQRPHILENYLINTIVRTQFPFGKEGVKPGAAPDRAREYAVLTAQFALTKGLLIGVAGFHGEAFNETHVVHTVQAAAKHFEHHPEFLNMAHALLVEHHMDGAQGLAILLRNAGPPPASDVPTPASPATPAPAPPDEKSA